MFCLAYPKGHTFGDESVFFNHKLKYYRRIMFPTLSPETHFTSIVFSDFDKVTCLENEMYLFLTLLILPYSDA